MSISMNSAGSGRGVSHGSGATLDNLAAAVGLSLCGWVNRRAAGSAQSIITKDGGGGTTLGFLLLSASNGNLQFRVARGANTTSTNFISADGVFAQDVDTFYAATFDDSASQKMRLWIGTRSLAPTEVSYTTTTAGSGTLDDDSAWEVWVGNNQRAGILPWLGDIQSGYVFAQAITPSEVLSIWASSYATNLVRAGCKLGYNYVTNATLIDGTGNGNNGTLLASAPTGTTIAVNSLTTVPVTSDSVYFSPYNWYSNGSGEGHSPVGPNNIKPSSTYARTNNPGAYFKTKVTVVAGVGAVNLSIDPSIMATLTASLCPTISVSVDGAAPTATLLTAMNAGVPIASGLAAGTHALEVWFKSIGRPTPGDRWVTPLQAITLSAIYIDGDASVSAPTIQAGNILVYGDSIFEGIRTAGSDQSNASADALQAAPRLLGRAFQSEYGAVCFAAQGYEVGIDQTTPDASHPSFWNSTDALQSWNKYSNGLSRLEDGLFVPVPDSIFVEHGINDDPLDPDSVTSALDALRDAAGDECWIFPVVTSCGTESDEIQEGAANVADSLRTRALVPTVLWEQGDSTEFANLADLHPNARGHAHLTVELVKLAEAAIAAASPIADSTGLTALKYIHAAAQKIGRFFRGTTTAGGSTSSLVCSTFVNTNLAASEFANFAVLIESGACAGEMGFVTNGGLTRSTGTISTADSFSAVIGANVDFSLYSDDRLPPLADGKRPGLFDMLNQSLERLWIEDTLTVPGVTNQIHYTIDPTVWPWFTDDTRIIEIQYPVTSADDVPRGMPRSSWSWVSDGETRKLRFPGGPFRTGENFTIKVNRPANSRLKIGGTWGDQTSQSAGLMSLTDEAIPDVNHVTPMMAALTFEALAEMGAPGQTVAEWMLKAQAWTERAVGAKANRVPRDANQGIVQLAAVRMGGSRRRGVWNGRG